MATFDLKFTDDEVEMLVDALEADMAGYLEAAAEARANNNREDVDTFSDAAKRVGLLMKRLQDLIE